MFEDLASPQANAAALPIPPGPDQARKPEPAATKLPPNTVPPRMLSWFRDIIISVVVAYFIITFVYQPVKVEGSSMLPQLRDQDRLFINKFAYRFEKIERGDVVVFYYPRDPSTSYIKRVIALPGDELRVEKGLVYVNGVLVPEPYVPEQFKDYRSVDDLVVPQGYYFMMGDHRSNSSDSRDFGPVRRGLIYGKASVVYWPQVDAGVVK
ncbi:MAG TPA: signal peptidase I [Acidisarcina sp.]